MLLFYQSFKKPIIVGGNLSSVTNKTIWWQKQYNSLRDGV